MLRFVDADGEYTWVHYIVLYDKNILRLKAIKKEKKTIALIQCYSHLIMKETEIQESIIFPQPVFYFLSFVEEGGRYSLFFCELSNWHLDIYIMLSIKKKEGRRMQEINTAEWPNFQYLDPMRPAKSSSGSPNREPL